MTSLGADYVKGASAVPAVVVSEAASDLERYAAAELCRYLAGCFGAEISPAETVPADADCVFLLGTPESNPAVAAATARRPFPELGEQGFLLRRVRFKNRKAMILGGGSPRATLWAVYDLAERWGVCHTTQTDLFPVQRSLWLPDLNMVKEPNLTIRQWRVVNAHASGPESWGIEDYRNVLGQLAKLKFNRVLFVLWPNQPFLHYEVRGIKRETANLFFGYRFPITDDMVGRALFGDAEEFYNPDFPSGAAYEELIEAGQRHIREIIRYAASRGMDCVIDYTLPEGYPSEFAPLLNETKPTNYHGLPIVVPGDSVEPDDPSLLELASATMRALVNTYPEAQLLVFDMPEHRIWAAAYERAWRSLDERYGIEAICNLASVLESASQRTGYPGGSQRAIQEVKGDIVNLYFWDRLVSDGRILERAGRPNVGVAWSSLAEELFPILRAISQPGWETLNFIDYTPSNIVRRPGALANVPSDTLPATLIFTLHDDNVGLLPQLTLNSLHTLTRELRRHNWAGFSTRYWQLADHDVSVSYIAQAAWDDSIVPQDVVRRIITLACGADCVDDMSVMFEGLQSATVLLEQHALGLTFYTPAMIRKQWISEPMPTELSEVRHRYRLARKAAVRAGSRSHPDRNEFIDYWAARLEFGIGYLDSVERLRQAAIHKRDGNAAGAVIEAEAALAAATTAIAVYASVARQQSDRASVAMLNEFVYRPMKIGLEQLRRGENFAP